MKRKQQIIKAVKEARRPENHTKEVLPAKTVKIAKPIKTLHIPKGEYFEGIGRRKVAVARVRIYHEKGDFIVNDKLVDEYFADVPLASIKYNQPFVLTKTEGDFAVTVKVTGSGKKSQLGAVVHGLSRALEKFDPKVRSFLKDQGLLSRDARMKETRKPGRGGKARRKRQSPKR